MITGQFVTVHLSTVHLAKISSGIFKNWGMSFLTVCRTSKYRQNTVDSSGTGQTSIDSSIYETPRSHRPYRSGFPKRYVSFDSNWVKQVPGQHHRDFSVDI